MKDITEHLTAMGSSKTQKRSSSKTPEGKVKQRVREVLQEFKAYTVMPATWGYGASGVPDFIVCYESMFIGIEVKSNKTSHPLTPLQQRNIQEIRRAGGYALVVDESNIDELRDLLTEIRDGQIT